ncbi:ATP-binding cassette domain-containing protein [Vibrio marisflavi]|uniref:ABC transporter ATP-binding protein ModF n=1 Tax=Vibrio marisflavi CECT 7928 TaxID=634439 RepID=A0ABN8E7P1_9VIBR|nr:ATP-binding cassette domain-containing protein [Vibrio marisflavi]CAH0541736.1 ABC transporter ATP-binding protein ModF [Vibrio marisflavi CECT 7928]
MQIQQLKYSSATSQLKIRDWKIESGQHWGIFASESHSSSVLGQLITGELQPTSGSIVDVPTPVACVSLSMQQGLLDEELAKEETDFLDHIDYGTSVEGLVLQAGCTTLELENILSLTDLNSLRYSGFRQLSTGESRRVMLAMALAKKPKLLILDEPYSGMDTHHRDQLSKLLDVLSRDIQLIIITSREDELPSCISHIALFDSESMTDSMSRIEWTSHPIKSQMKALSEQKSEVMLSLVEFQAQKLESRDVLIEMKDVSVSYVERGIFQGLNWQVKPGEHWQIKGPNGCGKSTLLGLITGDHPQSYSNNITVLGMKRGSGESIWDIKRQIGIVSSSLHLQYRIGCSALDVLLSGFFDSIGLYDPPSKKQLELAYKWLDVLEMSALEKVSFRSLEYGQQRLLLIGRALIKQPELLILDEPYQGLDYISRKLVFLVLNKIAQAKLSQILYVTHHEEDALDAIHNFVEFRESESGYTVSVERAE